MEQYDNTFHAKRYLAITDSYKAERWCEDCWLLKHLCICSQLTIITPIIPIRFHLFMHYKEYKRTSNTGILLKKLFANSEMYIGGIAEDLEKLLSKLENAKNICVLYPGDKSVELSEWVKKNEEGEKDFILLDSTWNVGRKLLKSLPSSFPRVRLLPVGPSLIKCKKQANPGFLSTLECAAYVMKELGDQEAFEAIMQAFVIKDKAALKQTNKHSLLKSLEENKHYDVSNLE